MITISNKRTLMRINYSDNGTTVDGDFSFDESGGVESVNAVVTTATATWQYFQTGTSQATVNGDLAHTDTVFAAIADAIDAARTQEADATE